MSKRKSKLPTKLNSLDIINLSIDKKLTDKQLEKLSKIELLSEDNNDNDFEKIVSLKNKNLLYEIIGMLRELGFEQTYMYLKK